MTNTCEFFTRVTEMWKSNESVTSVKNSNVFVTPVKNSCEFFTYVTRTYDSFTSVKDLHEVFTSVIRSHDMCDKFIKMRSFSRPLISLSTTMCCEKKNVEETPVVLKEIRNRADTKVSVTAEPEFILSLIGKFHLNPPSSF